MDHQFVLILDFGGQYNQSNEACWHYFYRWPQQRL